MKNNSVIFLLFFLVFCCTEELNAQESSPICHLDKSKMIPLRDATYRRYQFVAKLKGSAIKGDKEYEILFDTGSWTTSIPGGALDLSKVTILEENTRDVWGNLADLVSGQLILESVDGSQYVIDDYKFFATKDANTGQYLPDDRMEIYGRGTNSIMGAFPSISPYSELPSFPFALSEKYAEDNLGLGIVSNCLDNIEDDWDIQKSYLQIGIKNEVSSLLNWRSDIPNWRNPEEFHPEAVPGFKIKITTSNAQFETDSNLIATVDTGAPDLTLRLGPNDPQNDELLSSNFVRQGPWTNWGDHYRENAKTGINANVTVEFTDSENESNSYNFPLGNDPYASPNSLFVGPWAGDIPWAESIPYTPRNRINLGNTIYFYCPVYFWDIKNKRVGIGFRDKQTTSLKQSTQVKMLLYPNPAINQFTVRNPGSTPIESLTIYDNLGHIIQANLNYDQNGRDVNVTCNYHGLALVQISTASGSWIQKIILN